MRLKISWSENPTGSGKFHDLSDGFGAHLAILLKVGDCRQVPTRFGANGTLVTHGQKLVRMAPEMKPKFLKFHS